MLELNKIYNQDCLEGMQQLSDNSVDLIVSDPPYQLSSITRPRTDQTEEGSYGKEVPFSRQQSRIKGFMGKEWDVLPTTYILKESLRVLKDGAFAFWLMTPRQDSQAMFIQRLKKAGFVISFTPLYWCYASGFPKASNISKMVDKRNGTTPNQSREFAEYIKKKRVKLNLGLKEVDDFVCGGSTNYSWFEGRSGGQRLPKEKEYEKIKEILKLDNCFDNFIGEAERIIIGKSTRCIGKSQLLKTSSSFNLNIKDNDLERTRNITESSTLQAKALDGSYAGFQPKPAVEVIIVSMKPLSEKSYTEQALKNAKGITWLDDVRVPYFNESIITQSCPRLRNSNPDNVSLVNIPGEYETNTKGRFPANLICSDDVLDDGNFEDSGTFSRYFSLDSWWQEHFKKLPMSVQKTFPFMIVPKASSGEKNEGLDGFEERQKWLNGGGGTGISDRENITSKNIHPTCKPTQLMNYLITLGSRKGDLVLDPFIGSGTTAISARMLSRKFIGFEREAEYHKIAIARLKKYMEQKKLFEVI